jgi:small subunit ribosomal protein S7
VIPLVSNRTLNCDNFEDHTSPHRPTRYVMPPLLNITTLARSLPVRAAPRVLWPACRQSAIQFAASHGRVYSDFKAPPANDRSERTDSKPIEHVSEEEAKVAEAMGKEGPDLSRGTPIAEVRVDT